MATITDLLNLLTQYKGTIVSTGDLPLYQIQQAQASNRIYVDINAYGFVWLPDCSKIPETIKEVEFFEKWFPLDIELPEELKTIDWLYKVKINPKNN